MFRRALIPLDGSADAETILDHLPMVLLPDGEAILLHVLPETLAAADPAIWLQIQLKADAYLASMPLRGFQGTVKTFVDVGDPGERILGIAEAVKADLVALLTHSWKGLPRTGLGVVARRILRGVRPAVLIAQPGNPVSGHGIRRILFPIEGPGWTPADVDPVIPLAARGGADVLLVHVESDEPDPPRGRRLDPPLSPAADDPAGTYREAADYLRSNGISAQAVILHGNPTRQILNQAKVVGADLIVMSSRGRRGLERLAAGSVAESVVRFADRPVLVLRGTGVPARTVANGQAR